MGWAWWAGQALADLRSRREMQAWSGMGAGARRPVGRVPETCGPEHTGRGAPCWDSHTELGSQDETDQDTCCCVFLIKTQAFA